MKVICPHCQESHELDWKPVEYNGIKLVAGGIKLGDRFQKLSVTDEKLLIILIQRENSIVTRQTLYELLYWDKHNYGEIDPKIIDVFICKLRKKLKLFPIKVNNVWGRGYTLLNKQLIEGTG